MDGDGERLGLGIVALSGRELGRGGVGRRLSLGTYLASGQGIPRSCVCEPAEHVRVVNRAKCTHKGISIFNYQFRSAAYQPNDRSTAQVWHKVDRLLSFILLFCVYLKVVDATREFQPPRRISSKETWQPLSRPS